MLFGLCFTEIGNCEMKKWSGPGDLIVALGNRLMGAIGTSFPGLGWIPFGAKHFPPTYRAKFAKIDAKSHRY